MSRRPRPKLLSLTEAAAEQIRTLMEKQEAGFLRVGVKNAGCAGMEYTMEYTDSAAPLDECVKDQGVEILVDASAVLFVIGSVIDYEVTPLYAKFVFSNPNQTDACGCGESVTIQKAPTDWLPSDRRHV